MDYIRTLVACEDQEDRSNIIDMLNSVEYIKVIGEAGTTEEALELIDQTNLEVALIDSQLPGDGYKLAERIAEDYPGLSMIIIEGELKEETLRKAIFAGARDVLIYPFKPAKLIDSIYRSYQMEKKKESLQRDRLPRTRRKGKQGQVITVFSTKGGVGKTFISSNLAVALAQHTGEKVVLVDLDLDFGNAALALNIIPRYTLSDIVNEIRNLDQDLLESYLIPHKSGIKVLPANAQPQIVEFINSEHIEIILRVLQSAFDYVVVDMPARFYEPVNPAFLAADLLFLITTPEVATIRNIKASLVALNELNYPKSKIKVILNKMEPRGEIKPRDVETTLNHNLYGLLPADYKLVTSSLNKGIPVILLYPRAKISRSFQDLARQVSGNHKEKQVKVASENT
ncbi:MAG: response regulator [Candidatus Syntrophonatronum acetioxidans]|uniref:Stage 0 sporulation protein A homolog n=1 Tax=Candidatus Syntrophonatronum acetioxidans TaxID=1795816 RepID=A0A424YAS9_9FIRM|nr:MAG: response regulator [Candidatus Syntrophonatronum acetioxidans]